MEVYYKTGDQEKAYELKKVLIPDKDKLKKDAQKWIKLCFFLAELFIPEFICTISIIILNPANISYIQLFLSSHLFIL